MNILIINHSIKNCGVYQYGKRFSDILVKSKKYNFIYLELNSAPELEQALHKYNPIGIIYNYLDCTLPWLNIHAIQTIRSFGIKQYCIIHNTQYGFFDYKLQQDPYFKCDETSFALKRPLPSYIPKKQKNRKTSTINIGTFGFGDHCKQIPKICQLVSQEFFDEKVKLNFHLTYGHYATNQQKIEDIKNQCLSIIDKKTIELNVTNNFLEDNDLLDFLYSNDLNVFFYDSYSFYNGLSSSIDYALSVKKPIAICDSNMFTHIKEVTPSICVEKNSLKNIIKNGFHQELNEKYKEWSHTNFIKNVETIMEKTLIP